jgi:hypothetical protein
MRDAPHGRVGGSSENGSIDEKDRIEEKDLGDAGIHTDVSNPEYSSTGHAV